MALLAGALAGVGRVEPRARPADRQAHELADRRPPQASSRAQMPSGRGLATAQSNVGTTAFRRELRAAGGLPRRAGMPDMGEAPGTHGQRVPRRVPRGLAARAQCIDGTRQRGLDSLVGRPTGTVRLAAPPSPADCLPRRLPPPT